MAILIEFIRRIKLQLRWKMLGGFLLANLLLLAALGWAIFGLFNSGESLSSLRNSNDRLQAVSQIELLQGQMVNRALDYAWSDNLARLDEYELVRENLKAALAAFRPNQLQQQNYTRLSKELTSLQTILDAMIKQNRDGNEQLVITVWRTQGSKQAAQARELTQELSQQELASATREFQEAERRINGSVGLVSGLAGLALLLAVGLASLFTTALTGSVAQLNRRLDNLAEGDLTQRVQLSNQDEIGELGVRYNRTLTSLQALVRQLYQQSQQVSSASEQLTAQVRDQVIGNSQQADAITEVTQALQELNQTTAEIARQANDAAQAVEISLKRAQLVNQVAEEMAQAQEQGRTMVASTIRALQDLKEQIAAIEEQQRQLATQATAIQDITDLINGIARETHLLALNAAIESAGAGAYGSRFSVIAGEVKQLSDRSMAATQDVRTALNGISQAVERAGEGARQGLIRAEQAVLDAGHSDAALLSLTSLSEQVKNSARDIVSQVRDTVQLTGQIGIVTRQQQVASHQMLEKMIEIQAVTTQSLNSVKEGEAVTSQLRLSAHKLEESADAFKLTKV